MNAATAGATHMNGVVGGVATSSGSSFTGSQGQKRANSPRGIESERPSKISRQQAYWMDEEGGRTAMQTRIGSVMVGSSKDTDLFGKLELRTKLERISKDHGVRFDEETLRYLSLATESRLRNLLSSAINAQIHRTTSHHLHVPPISKKGRPMWSTKIIGDTNAVLEALASKNREEEQTFRANRMDRIAKETQIQRAREAREKAVEESGGSASVSGVAGMGLNGNAEAGPSNQVIDNSSSLASGGDSPTTQSPKKGGGTKEKGGGGSGAGGGGSGKRKKSSAKDVSANIAHQSTNNTANRAVGNRRVYSWMTNQPANPSPLGMRKSKSKKPTAEDDGEDGDSGTPEPGSPAVKVETANGTERPDGSHVNGTGSKKKSRLKESHNSSRSKVNVTAPPRRMVLVDQSSGGEKRVSDDKALTLTDVLFALDRDGVGRGMGSADEVVRKAWAKPGGPWRFDMR